jgi:hypothetical protein
MNFSEKVGWRVVTWASRLFVSLMAIPVLFVILLLTGKEYSSAVRWAFVVYGALFGVGAVLYLITNYLNSPSRTRPDARLEERVGKLETLLETSSRNITLEGNDIASLREVVVSILEEVQASGKDSSKLPMPDAPSSAWKWADVISGFDVTKNRLLKEMDELSRRTNLNLALGTVTTIVAGIGLIFMVVLSPVHFDATNMNAYPWLVVAHYLPRLSLIVFAEIFAYFFLRLYKASLPEAKFYQNEITNIEMRLTALKASLLMENSESLAVVVQGLSRMERNIPAKLEKMGAKSEKPGEIDERYILETVAGLLKIKAP